MNSASTSGNGGIIDDWLHLAKRPLFPFAPLCDTSGPRLWLEAPPVTLAAAATGLPEPCLSLHDEAVSQ